MFREWFRYGSVEVANNHRVVSYIRNGMTPVGAVIGDCTDCHALPEAVGVPGGEYRTPALDLAPWVSQIDEDSKDFLGVHVVEVTGLEGSTEVASVEERLGDGGVLATRRAESRTIAVTADVVGRTPEGADYGLEWLSASLHPPCAEGTDCTGDVLHLFSTCPQMCEGTVDPDSTEETTTFLPGEFADPEPSADGGFIIVGPEVGPICDKVEIRFAMSPIPPAGFGEGPYGLTPFGGHESESMFDVGLVDAGGTVIEMRPAWEVDYYWVVELSEVPAGSFLAIRSPYEEHLDLVLGIIIHKHVYTAEECVQPYRRHFSNVVTVSGPRVVDWRTLGDSTSGSTVARVEWTWVALEPHAWHPTTPLVLGASATANTESYRAPGIPITAPAAIGATPCARPAVTLASCVDDPDCSPVLAPPQAPSIADPCAPAPTGFQRRRFEVPETLTPPGIGVLSWTFDNAGAAMRGIRVRIWEDTDPAFLPETECEFSYEFMISYLGPGQTLNIDGTSGSVSVVCGFDDDGDPIYAPGLRNIRGPYGGPFDPSLRVGCGRPLVVAVDTPTTSAGLTWSVNLTRRA